jgi:hypothetical protein
MLDIYRNSATVIVWLGPDEVYEFGQSMADNAKGFVSEMALIVESDEHRIWSKSDQAVP